jgi:hypothetical protein
LPEGWVAFKDANVDKVDDESETYQSGINDVYSWKGVAARPWFYPQYPNAPKDDRYYVATSAVTLYVLTIPADLKQDMLEENIRIYGSADKIPDEKKEKDITTILGRAAPVYQSDIMRDYNYEDLTFNDSPAHLEEMETYGYSNLGEDASSFGRMAILLDENTIGIIDVYVERRSPSGQFFDGKARDIIDSFKIRKE